MTTPENADSPHSNTDRVIRGSEQSQQDETERLWQGVFIR